MLHSLSNSASALPSQSSTSRAFEPSVAVPRPRLGRPSPRTRRAVVYGSVWKTVFTLYSDSKRYFTTSNCSAPTAARIGSIRVCPYG